MELVEGKLYTMPEVSEILNFERHTIYKLIKEGKLKGIQTTDRGKWRVSGKELNKFMRW